MERLHKHLAQAGVCSRRAAERLIEQGRVSVNGDVITTLGSRIDPDRDVVEVDGKRVRPQTDKKIYIMLNKPRGCVTTLADPQGRPTIRDLIRGIRWRVFPVGRLDFNSEGLLLLTNDGELARDLMHPGRAVPKTYSVKVRGQPDATDLGRLARGVVLDGRRTRPARSRIVKPGANSWLEVTVHEGRKHQVRRMLRAVGHPVLKLRRVSYAGIRLGRLAPGSRRHLTAEEVRRLRRAPASGGRPPRERRRARPS